MFFRPASTLAILIAVASPALADTDIVLDDFESYADSAALQAAWVSTGAAGDPSSSTFLTVPSDGVYPDLTEGQAAVFDGSIGIGAGSVNQWQGSSFNVAPSATQNVEISVDLGHDFITSNKKLTLGLRGPAGIIELGFFNQLPQGPNGQFFQMAYRNVLFAAGATNWQPYSLDQSLDQVFELGESAFHRFKAVISETDVTFTLDLYADGLDNAASGGGPADYDNDGNVDGNDLLVAQRNGNDIALWESEYGRVSSDVFGVDATDVVPAVVNSGGFDDLRFGIPSGAGSSADPFLGVDNVSLRLVDITSGPSTFGAVPEPGSIVLALLAMVQGCLAARRR